MNKKYCKGCGTEIEEFEEYCSACRWFFRFFVRNINIPQKYDKFDKDTNKWRLVLEEVYRDNWHVYGYKNLNNDHPLAKKLKISGKSIQKSLSFLEENQLIKNVENLVYLTPKGFNVARANQNLKINAILQVEMIYFTVILAATTMFQFFGSLKIWSNTVLLLNYIVSICLIVVVSYFWIFKKFIR